jgi:CBS domain-containing protein
MKVVDILEIKGRSLHTIKPTETVGKLARQLQQNRVGVMIVTADGETIDGIISERDIAYSLADRRGELHLLPVSTLMTRDVITCSPHDSLSEVARLMTKHHIRHLPVKADQQLIGLISIRDVLEWRLDEVESKSKLLMNWLADPE